jgi:hypothetical protein
MFFILNIINRRDWLTCCFFIFPINYTQDNNFNSNNNTIPQCIFHITYYEGSPQKIFNPVENVVSQKQKNKDVSTKKNKKKDSLLLQTIFFHKYSFFMYGFGLGYVVSYYKSYIIEFPYQLIKRCISFIQSYRKKEKQQNKN